MNPSLESPEAPEFGACVVPIYPAAGALGKALLRRLVRAALDSVDPRQQVAEPLPESLRARHGLPALGEALERLHRPGDDADLEQLNTRSSPGHRRLIYGELLEQQLELALRRQASRRVTKTHRYRIDHRLRQRLRSIPPFSLTGAQDRVLEEILLDLARPHPMSRLLQGDVGSGKTIVAALALAAALEGGFQAALMAPTEILAEQHYRTLSDLLGERYRVGLVTGSVENPVAVRRELADGSTQLAVGTHALIQESVGFANLALAVIDEQHRFGVAQRRRLQVKGDSIDLLVMTATPIPRSLALTVYGDLDLSIIDQLPPGRQPVETRVVEDPDPRRVTGWLRRRLQEGHQAYVVVPLIESSSKVKAAALEKRGEEIRRRLAAFEPAIVHGKTPPEERRRILAEFADGSRRLLIATTLIEVGLDVPAAGAMVIENAERFGLAQLHQLRGRVGRGGQESSCLAVSRNPSDEARRRLRAFSESADGFELAEADLSIRGPGDLLGTRQAGLAPLRLASLVADRGWLEVARKDAAELIGRATEPEVAVLLAGVRARAAKRPERGLGA